MSASPVLETALALGPVRRGKVRDIYDLGDRLLIVSTDRISAFDWVLPNGIPDKGKALTQISMFWFQELGQAHHVLTADVAAEIGTEIVAKNDLAGRSMIVRKCRVVPIECVVRGYLVGSGWKEYQQNQTVCGVRLPSGLREAERLPEPIFTPATKASSGHDVNISFSRMSETVGAELAEELRARSLSIYQHAASVAEQKGILLADTKFEFGMDGERLILIDEVLTPDSSRFWLADQYQVGRVQSSLDKQPVRDWLEASGWDKNSHPPQLPADIVAQTRSRYLAALELLSGQGLGD